MNFFSQINPPCLVVAELSANHGNNYAHTCDLVQAAFTAGADAIKLQTYTPQCMTLNSSDPAFQAKNPAFNGRSLYSVYEEGAMPWNWQPKLKELAESLGMMLFSTPFSPQAVDFLESLNVPCHKVASFELIDHPLLEKVAATGKPVVLSTGMASFEEIEEAVDCLRRHGTTDLTLLKCTSAYPAPPEEAHLLTLPHMAATFKCRVGLSDHTLGSAVAVASVALGAKLIEKHFALSREDGTLDASFSMTPGEFAQMVQDVRVVEKALGQVNYDITPKQERSRQSRRSLFVVQDIKVGEEFTPQNIQSLRPALGLPPKHYHQVIGTKAPQDIPAGSPLRDVAPKNPAGVAVGISPTEN